MRREATAASDTDSSRALGRSRCLGNYQLVQIAVVLVLALAACGAGAKPATTSSTTGGIAGLARDQDSGDPVAKAEIRVRATGQFEPLATISSDRGLFDIQELRPG